MSVKTEIVERQDEVAVYHCDFCDKRIGPAPIDKHGGYSLNTGIQAKDDKRSLWHVTACRECMDDLRARSGFDA